MLNKAAADRSSPTGQSRIRAGSATSRLRAFSAHLGALRCVLRGPLKWCQMIMDSDMCLLSQRRVPAGTAWGSASPDMPYPQCKCTAGVAPELDHAMVCRQLVCEDDPDIICGMTARQ